MSKRPVAIGDNDKDPRYCKFDWAKCDQTRVHTNQELTPDTQISIPECLSGDSRLYPLFFLYIFMAQCG